MIVEVLVFILTFLIVYLLYSYKRLHSFFESKGVKYLPGVPIFGNAYNSTMLKKHMVEDIDVVYKAFPNEKYVGYMESTVPILLIRDPELIKKITVKDFDHFVDHREFLTPDTDPLFGGSLFMMKGDKWRDMRTTLSPAFTGSKMKQMMPFITEISNNIIEYLKAQSNEEVNITDLMRRYSNDVIASAGFGLQVNSVKDKDNEFYRTGQNLFNFSFKQRVLMTLWTMFPKLTKVIDIKLFSKETIQFFRDLVSDTMEYRRKNNVERPDMIQLLMEASKGTPKSITQTAEKDDNLGYATTEEDLKLQGTVRKWTEDELIGQVFIFFAAGFETASSVLITCVHELALNPDVQEKLYQEVKAFKEQNSKLTYDNLQKLKYLENTLNETLRKWAPALVMDRVCIKPYELPPPREGGKPYRLNPGDVVYNMVNSLHMDPQYYPQPDKFDPDRFSDDNKHNIQPFTFSPFGAGPRICLGSRLALLELKVLLYNLILNFKVLKCPKTTDPIRLLAQDFNIRVKGGSWVKLEART